MSNLSLQALDKSRQQAGKVLTTLLDTTAIETADDAKRVINDAIAVGKYGDTAIADTLYAVFNKGLLNTVTYTDKNGKAKKCVTITDFAKTIPALKDFSTASLYEYKDYGEMRSWCVYRKDKDGNIIFGKIKRDNDGKAILIDLPATTSTGVALKDIDGNIKLTAQYDYEPATVKTVVNGSKVENVTDGEPIIDLYLTAEYIKTLSLYGKTKSAIVLKKLGQAIAILKLHDNARINPNMSKTELKAVIDKLLIKPNDSKPTESDSKPTESDSKPTESDSKPTESDSKPTESDSKPTESDSKSIKINGEMVDVLYKCLLDYKMYLINDISENGDGFAEDYLQLLNKFVKAVNFDIDVNLPE